MSDILERLKSIEVGDDHPANRTWQFSVKLRNGQYAAVSAAQSLMGGSSKSDAVRFLIDLGWEAIENDGGFMATVEHKDELHRILDFGEDMEA